MSIQAPKSKKYDKNTKRGEKTSLYLLQKDIFNQLKTVTARITVIVVTITGTINNDGTSIEVAKNDKGIKTKIKIANAMNLKDIFLS